MNSFSHREAGRTPVRRNTFYEPIKVWDAAPTANEADRRQANQKCLKATWQRRKNLVA